MPFINEQISDELADKYGLLRTSWWTFDHERNIALKWYESNRFRFTKGYLFWKGEKLDWTAYMHHYYINNDYKKNRVIWKNVGVSIPSHLECDCREIGKAMYDGLKVCGISSRNEHNVKEVVVTLVKSQQFEGYVEEKAE